MKKRGQTELAVLVATGLVLVIGGTIYTASTIAKSSTSMESITKIYFGDLDNNLVFDRTKCNIKLSNYTIFTSLEEARSLGFKDKPNCV